MCPASGVLDQRHAGRALVALFTPKLDQHVRQAQTGGAAGSHQAERDTRRAVTAAAHLKPYRRRLRTEQARMTARSPGG